MHFIKIHKVVCLVISLFYRMGIWHRGDQPTVKEIRIKFFYSGFHALTNDRRDKSIFLADVAIGVAVLSVKLWMLMWNQKNILHLLNRVCVFSIQDDNDYKFFDDKLKGFVQFAFTFIVIVTFDGSLSTLVLSLLGSEKTLYMEIAFPLDYKHNEIAFWIATTFIFTEFLLTIFAFIFTTIIWYFLLICSLRYKLLGNDLKNMGRISENNNKKIREEEVDNNFLKSLITLIGAHLHLKELITEVEYFFSGLFFMQFATSGVSICLSIYCLAFDIGESLLERIMFLLVFIYLIADLFMITYFGNEIMLSSDCLSYCLFESDWYNQPQSTKKNIIIFGEYLKQPQVFVIGKLYPLTLETFTRILNSAYSMFNILKSFQ
ncbi:odorant receptor 4-like isoform X2 [Bradysia coprophila]|uniref:odorant receptor 4-like isoform X2 n=1 Tax=Bradysia coprophila TaxID=38358 RepID=UPI00187DD6DB|nr:odorant receptor 4-like isoform X2 [Bradysia coprophila]